MVKVFLVEDDPTMDELLKTLMKLEGFEVESATDLEDILPSVKQYLPDVILLDVHLRPGGDLKVNGFELLRQIRADVAIHDKKVILYSGTDFRIESREAGADGFIVKPFMPDELIQKIKDLVC